MWIDALCIDQSNVQERSHQVTLMSDIYSQAAGVVIYLGENTTDSDLAIDYILDTDNPAEGNLLEFTKSAALIHALDHLFNRPWFNRVWVIQEVAFAVDATVICGTRTFSWSAIQNFKYWVACTEWLRELPFVVHTAKPVFRDRMSDDCSPILTELDRARHCDATDPRDKIYALLPFLHVTEFGINVSPDYRSSPAKVFTGFAAALVTKCGFRVLQSVQGRPAVSHLPSWVPDWTVRPTRMIMRPNWDEELKRLSTSEDQKHSLRVVQVEVEDRSTPEGEGQMCRLRAYGYKVGHITKIGSAYLAGQGSFPLHEWMRLWMFSSNTWRRLLQFTLAKCRRKPDSTTDDTLFSNDHTFVQQERERFMKVISCDRWSGWYGLSFIKTWVRMEAQRNSNGSRDESWEKSVRELARNQTGEQARDEHVLSYKDIPFQNAGYCFISTAKAILEDVLRCCHSRRFFLTDTGYWGLAPLEAQFGDQIYYCVGGEVPFVFRSARNTAVVDDRRHLKLIGECFTASTALEGKQPSPDALECFDII
jgi:hypothetical protein